MLGSLSSSNLINMCCVIIGARSRKHEATIIELVQPSQMESWISINIKFGLDLSLSNSNTYSFSNHSLMHDYQSQN